MADAAEKAAPGSESSESFFTAAAIGASAAAIPLATSTLGGGVGSTAPFAPASTSAWIASGALTPAHPFLGDANTGTEIFPRTASATLPFGARMRSAPSLAAMSAACSSLTPHATTPDAELRLLRATTTGTPSSDRTTPSHSADAAMSVRSATSSALFPERLLERERGVEELPGGGIAGVVGEDDGRGAGRDGSLQRGERVRVFAVDDRGGHGEDEAWDANLPAGLGGEDSLAVVVVGRAAAAAAEEPADGGHARGEPPAAVGTPGYARRSGPMDG